MAEGTRGRSIADGAKTIRIHGANVSNRAAVAHVSGLSGHAGKSELLRWLEPLPTPRFVYLTHGEKRSAQAFAETLRQTRDWNVQIPALGEVVEL